MTTTCQNCKKQFVPTSTTGVPQKYCSSKCRNKSANDRRFERYRENIINDVEGDRLSMDEHPKKENEISILTKRINFLEYATIEMGKQHLNMMDHMHQLLDIVTKQMDYED